MCNHVEPDKCSSGYVASYLSERGSMWDATSARAGREPGDKRAIQILQSDRLGDHVVHAGLQAPLAIFPGGIGRQRDNRQAWAGPFAKPDLGGSFVAIHFRHLAVHENQVIRRHLQHLQCLAPVAGGIGPQAQLGEQQQRHSLVDRVVLHDQHSRAVAVLKAFHMTAEPGDRRSHGLAGAMAGRRGSGAATGRGMPFGPRGNQRLHQFLLPHGFEQSRIDSWAAQLAC